MRSLYRASSRGYLCPNSNDPACTCFRVSICHLEIEIRLLNQVCADALDESSCKKLIEKQGNCYQSLYGASYGDYCQRSCGFCSDEEDCNAFETIENRCEQKCVKINGKPTCTCYEGYKVDLSLIQRNVLKFYCS